MKTISKSILLASLLSIGINLKAQDSITIANPHADFPRAELGFRFMPTISAFDMETSSGGKIKGEGTLGYGFGAFLGFNFTDHIGMSGEIIYNSLSQKYKDADLERAINVRYVNIPILLSLNTGKSNPVNLKIEAGPQIGFNAGANVTSSSGASTDTVQTVFATKSGDFGFAYGAGFEFVLNQRKTIRMDLGFRGVYGLVNISNTSKANGTDTYYILDRAIVRTNSLYLGMTLLF
ncbi:MAG: porin family protein [Bacteroidetes bacterium]|nr:porin family protein [Bacteroidota bacterium]